jgi:hypothetical protein
MIASAEGVARGREKRDISKPKGILYIGLSPFPPIETGKLLLQSSQKRVAAIALCGSIEPS